MSSKRVTGNISQNKNAEAFIKIYNKMAISHDHRGVWVDFVTAFACSLSNIMDAEERDNRSKLIENIFKRYSEDAQKQITELMGITGDELSSNSDQDFLGEIYSALNLYSKAKSQFFTPYSISKLMASICLGNPEEEIRKKGFVSINDPCCGAGAMLIAAANVCEQQGINLSRDILFVAQDIDPVVAYMCYIQLALLGCAGYILIGNSLSMEPITRENRWLLPGLFNKVWVDRGYMSIANDE